MVIFLLSDTSWIRHCARTFARTQAHSLGQWCDYFRWYPEKFLNFRQLIIFVNGFDGKSILVAVLGPWWEHSWLGKLDKVFASEHESLKGFIKSRGEGKNRHWYQYQLLLYSGKDLSEDEKCLGDYLPRIWKSQVQLSLVPRPMPNVTATSPLLGCTRRD